MGLRQDVKVIKEKGQEQELRGKIRRNGDTWRERKKEMGVIKGDTVVDSERKWDGKGKMGGILIGRKGDKGGQTRGGRGQMKEGTRMGGGGGDAVREKSTKMQVRSAELESSTERREQMYSRVQDSPYSILIRFQTGRV